jgi:hypothetical protein
VFAKRIFVFCAALFLLTCFCLPAFAQESNAIPPGSKVYIAPMDGFETYLKAALNTKRVPLEVVEQKDQADFVITGAAETQKASTAKKVIMWDWRSKEQASITVTNVKTSIVVFAYSYHASSSAHGKRSSAEACAKHLKEKIEGKS